MSLPLKRLFAPDRCLNPKLKLGENEKMRYTQSLKPGMSEGSDFRPLGKAESRSASE